MTVSSARYWLDLQQLPCAGVHISLLCNVNGAVNLPCSGATAATRAVQDLMSDKAALLPLPWLYVSSH